MYIEKRIKLFVFPILFLLLFCSCQEKKQPETETLKYPTQIGNLTLYSEPDTILPLTDEIAAALIELGHQDKIIGISKNNTIESLSGLPTAGTSDSPDLESVLSLKPELLITDTPLSSAQMEQLSEGKVRVLVLSGKSSQYEDILSKITGNFMAGNSVSIK